MPRYRIYYLKESQRQHFRQAPPSGPSPLKLKSKDYQPAGEIEAASPYAAWKQMRAESSETPNSRRPIDVGDALETEAGTLLVCKYVGFEEAQWFVPEPAGPAEAPPAPTAAPEN